MMWFMKRQKAMADMFVGIKTIAPGTDLNDITEAGTYKVDGTIKMGRPGEPMQIPAKEVRYTFGEWEALVKPGITHMARKAVEEAIAVRNVTEEPSEPEPKSDIPDFMKPGLIFDASFFEVGRAVRVHNDFTETFYDGIVTRVKSEELNVVTLSEHTETVIFLRDTIVKTITPTDVQVKSLRIVRL